MEYIGLDVHLYTSTLHVLDRCGGDLKTVTIKGGWQKVVGWLRQRRRGFSICDEASAGYGPLHDALAKIARRVVVAHPGHLRLQQSQVAEVGTRRSALPLEKRPDHASHWECIGGEK